MADQLKVELDKLNEHQKSLRDVQSHLREALHNRGGNEELRLGTPDLNEAAIDFQAAWKVGLEQLNQIIDETVGALGTVVSEYRMIDGYAKRRAEEIEGRTGDKSPKSAPGNTGGGNTGGGNTGGGNTGGGNTGGGNTGSASDDSARGDGRRDEKSAAEVAAAKEAAAKAAAQNDQLAATATSRPAGEAAAAAAPGADTAGAGASGGTGTAAEGQPGGVQPAPAQPGAGGAEPGRPGPNGAAPSQSGADGAASSQPGVGEHPPGRPASGATVPVPSTPGSGGPEPVGADSAASAGLHGGSATPPSPADVRPAGQHGVDRPPHLAGEAGWHGGVPVADGVQPQPTGGQSPTGGEHGQGRPAGDAPSEQWRPVGEAPSGWQPVADPRGAVPAWDPHGAVVQGGVASVGTGDGQMPPYGTAAYPWQQPVHPGGWAPVEPQPWQAAAHYPAPPGNPAYADPYGQGYRAPDPRHDLPVQQPPQGWAPQQPSQPPYPPHDGPPHPQGPHDRGTHYQGQPQYQPYQERSQYQEQSQYQGQRPYPGQPDQPPPVQGQVRDPHGGHDESDQRGAGPRHDGAGASL